MAEREEPEEGRKGGSLEGGMAYPRYYEPTVTAVTDMVVPATRVQWGPVIAGVIVALAFTLLFMSLGIALGLGAYGLSFWAVAFTSIGLFLGAILTARTAKADFLPAIVHGVIVWGIVLILHAITLGNFGSALASNAPAGTSAAALSRGFGWWFFIGFIIMLGATLAGALLGRSPVHHEEQTR